MNTFETIGSAELHDLFVMSENNTPDIHARLYKMIDYAKDRFHWYEDQREKKLGLAIGMVTLSGVSLTLLVNSVTGKGIDPASIQFRLVCLIQLLLTFTSFCVVLIYLRGQNLIYTHRQGLNSIFSWYGYGVPPIDRVSLFEFLILGRFSDLTLSSQNDSTLEFKQKQLINGYKKFSSKVVPRLGSSEKAANEDLQQIYILQIFQVIARDNLQYMISCLKFGGMAVAFATISLIIIVLVYGIPLKVG
jgi:hypothetical protein